MSRRRVVKRVACKVYATDAKSMRTHNYRFAAEAGFDLLHHKVYRRAAFELDFYLVESKMFMQIRDRFALPRPKWIPIPNGLTLA